MKTEQLELTPVAKGGAERVSAEEVQEFLALLADGGWHSAAGLGARTEDAKRQMRWLAEAGGGEVISGNLGYKLRSAATEAEFARSVGRLKSQIRRMSQRIVALCRARHTAVHRPSPLSL